MFSKLTSQDIQAQKNLEELRDNPSLQIFLNGAIKKLPLNLKKLKRFAKGTKRVSVGYSSSLAISLEGFLGVLYAGAYTGFNPELKLEDLESFEDLEKFYNSSLFFGLKDIANLVEMDAVLSNNVWPYADENDDEPLTHLAARMVDLYPRESLTYALKNPSAVDLISPYGRLEGSLSSDTYAAGVVLMIRPPGNGPLRELAAQLADAAVEALTVERTDMLSIVDVSNVPLEVIADLGGIYFPTDTPQLAADLLMLLSKKHDDNAIENWDYSRDEQLVDIILKTAESFRALN